MSNFQQNKTIGQPIKRSKGRFFQDPVERCKKMCKDVNIFPQGVFWVIHRAGWFTEWQSDRNGRPWAYWVSRCSTARNLSLYGSSTITGPSVLICVMIWRNIFFIFFPDYATIDFQCALELQSGNFTFGFCAKRICPLLSAKGSAIFISLPHTSHWAVKRLGT